jgi:hypothetical protein
MARIKVMPLIGAIQQERLESLRGCHAIQERTVVKHFEVGGLEKAMGDALKELLIADRVTALENQKLQFIIIVEV